MPQPLVLLELNEVNFDFVATYVKQGHLPTLGRMIAEYGVTETTSETEYEDLEPWIQWVTAHTGLSLAEHGVFRLGDIVDRDIPQIWEQLEERGCRVGAISPMNAKNRMRAPAFFVPDPWTQTTVTGSSTLQGLYRAVAQAVDDNAQSRITATSAARLLRGLLRYARWSNAGTYLGCVLRAGSHPWRKAMFLDLLLADVFLKEVSRTRPDFASLFLNAAAHIQHHYMFSSGAYQGGNRNPEWYINPGLDPVLEVYSLYDRIVAKTMQALGTTRVMLATGLHQVPHGKTTYYWRLLDHESFLRQHGVKFERVQALMSRDFVLECRSAEAAATAAMVLGDSRDAAGVPLFEIDNRGRDLFVMLTYPQEFRDGQAYRVCGTDVRDMRSQVAFVALKNGEHHGTGYLVDTGAKNRAREMPLKTLPTLIQNAVLPVG